MTKHQYFAQINWLETEARDMRAAGDAKGAEALDMAARKLRHEKCK